MKYGVLILSLILLQSCARDRKAEVDKAMQDYSLLLKHLAGDSIADTFLPKGVLVTEGQPSIVGSDSIRKLFTSFKGFSVLEYKSVPKSTIIKGDTAFQEGSYEQHVIIPAGDTLHLGGQFSTIWLDDPGAKRWMILKMATHDYTNLAK